MRDVGNASFGSTWLAADQDEQERWKQMMNAASARVAAQQSGSDAVRSDGAYSAPAAGSSMLNFNRDGYVSPTPGYTPMPEGGIPGAYGFQAPGSVDDPNFTYREEGVPDEFQLQTNEWSRGDLVSNRRQMPPPQFYDEKQGNAPNHVPLWKGQTMDEVRANSRPLRFEVQDGLDRYSRFRQDLAATLFGGSAPR